MDEIFPNPDPRYNPFDPIPDPSESPPLQRGLGASLQEGTPGSCKGENCNMCRVNPASHKVEEVIFDDDPNPRSWQDFGGQKILARHPSTAYVCRECFHKIMGHGT
jgi:hypothetical protein